MSEQPQETRCNACLYSTTTDRVGWFHFSFKHLSPVWICPKCLPEWKEHMEKLRRAGL